MENLGTEAKRGGPGYQKIKDPGAGLAFGVALLAVLRTLRTLVALLPVLRTLRTLGALGPLRALGT